MCAFHQSVVTPPGGDPVTVEEDGCSFVPQESYSVNRSLTSATLDPVTVTVDSTVCDDSGCTEISRGVTVSGSWVGKDTPMRFNDKDTIVFGDCVVVFMGKNTLREVAATLNYGGQTYVTEDAGLSRSRDRTKISSGCG